MIRITQKGLQDKINDISPSHFNESSEYAMKKASEIAEKDANKKCPVYSGVMKDNIYVKYNKAGFIIRVERDNKGFDVAHMNEYGKSPYWRIGKIESPNKYENRLENIGYHPFVRPAVLKGAKEYPKYFGQKWYRKG